VPGEGWWGRWRTAGFLIASRAIPAAWGIAPPGIQALSTTRPEGEMTRAISATAAVGSGAKMTPNTETTRSALPSSSGSSAAFPTANFGDPLVAAEAPVEGGG